MKKYNYFISCPLGLENVLLEEVKSFGIDNNFTTRGGLHFKGTFRDAIHVVLNSRIASRVFKKIRSFEIKSEKDLYYKTREINWSKEFHNQSTIKVITTQSTSRKHKKHSKFKNVHFISQNIKDAIVDRFKMEKVERPSVDIKSPDIILHAHIEPNDNIHSSKEEATLLYDLTGIPLSNRGLREGSHPAPIRENIAAGILDLLEWEPNAEPFFDIMCGSGTFLFEAYFKKYNIPPQFKKIKMLARSHKKEFWSFQKLFFYKDNQSLQEDFVKELGSAKNRTDVKASEIIMGFDCNHNAISETEQTIKKNKLESFISVKQDDARKFKKSAEKKSLYFCNPPYGKRMGNTPQLENLYFEVGENLKQNYPGSKLGIISTNKDLLKKIALAPSLKHNLNNGPELLRIVRYDIQE